MTVKPIEAIVLIVLAIMSLAISANAQNQVRNFQPEWCAFNKFRHTSDVDQICFGRANFLNASDVRAIGFRFPDGHNELYVEAQFPKVELLTLSFEIVGPVRDSFYSEFGQVVLSIDEDGEVNAVQGQSGRHGRFGAFRDSRDQLP